MKPDKKPQLKADDVNIIGISTFMMPGAIAGQLVLNVVGIGTDNMLYIWDAKEKVWYAQ